MTWCALKVSSIYHDSLRLKQVLHQYAWEVIKHVSDLVKS